MEGYAGAYGSTRNQLHVFSKGGNEEGKYLPFNRTSNGAASTLHEVRPTYAVALRELFYEYKMRAQMNTKYMESSTREATVTHVLNLLISQLTRADIQSTITPDEGRNVPWHIYNIEAVDTAKQAFAGMDGLNEMVEIKRHEGELADKVRELKERAILFMEEILEVGGYFKAVEEGFFVDSGYYPERNGDGIARKIDGGIGAGTV